MKNRLFRLLLLCLPIIFGSSNAQIGLAPLYVRLSPTESSPTQTIFTVINGSDKSIRFRAVFSPYTFKGTTIQYESTSESDLSPYLRAAPLEFEVPAFSEQAIRVVALVPPSLLENELRAALVLEPLLDTQLNDSNSNGSLTGQVAYSYQFIAQMFLGQSGSVEVDIKNVKYSSDQNVQLAVSNSGTTSGITNINWELTMADKQVASSEQATRFVVLTKGERVYNLIQGINLTPGTYTLTGTFGTEDGGEPPVVINPQPFTKTFTVK